MKLKSIVTLFLTLSSFTLFAQDTLLRSNKRAPKPHSTKGDTTISCFSLSMSYAGQLPGGDMVQRFGPNSNAGASFLYKSNKNLVFGFNWAYLFGQTMNGTNPLDSISTSDGHVIDAEGKYADIRIFERGFTLSFSAGKVFNCCLSPNKNSGLMLSGGLGYLQHKLKIYDNGARSPQLTKEYLKGYDRLTSGLMVTEFVGYWYMSKNRYVNFYGGFEFNQGFTKSRRSWDYALMRADTENRLDLLSGFRLGWVIPLYKRNSANKYYY